MSNCMTQGKGLLQPDFLEYDGDGYVIYQVCQIHLSE